MEVLLQTLTDSQRKELPDLLSNLSLDFATEPFRNILPDLLLDRSRCILGRKYNIVWGVSEKMRQEITLAEAKEILTSTNSNAEMVTPREVAAKMNSAADAAAGYRIVDTKNWQDYVREPKIEIACGEAPFITEVSEQDLTQRAGFLDRKLYYVNKYCEDETNWQKWARAAYQATYGYELRGDKLLKARWNLLKTYHDFYQVKFPGQKIPERCWQEIAEIISWNLFQMDGKTGMVAGRKLLVKIKDWQNGQVVEFLKVGR